MEKQSRRFGGMWVVSRNKSNVMDVSPAADVWMKGGRAVEKMAIIS